MPGIKADGLLGGCAGVGYIEMGDCEEECEENSIIYKPGTSLSNLGSAVGAPDLTLTSIGSGCGATDYYLAEVPASAMPGQSFTWSSIFLVYANNTNFVGQRAWDCPGGFSGFQATAWTYAYVSGNLSGNLLRHEAGLNKGIGLPVYGFSQTRWGEPFVNGIGGTLCFSSEETVFPELPPVSVGSACNLSGSYLVGLQNAGSIATEFFYNGVSQGVFNVGNFAGSRAAFNMANGTPADLTAAWLGVGHWRTNCEGGYTLADVSAKIAEFLAA